MTLTAKTDVHSARDGVGLISLTRREDSAPTLITIGVIAAEVGSTVERVCRILRARRHIKPRAYAGNTRLFDDAAIAQVRHELSAIDARRTRSAR